MTELRTILRDTTRDLLACGSPSPRLDAEVLLMHFLKIDRLGLVLHPERRLSEAEATAFAAWVARRCGGEPVAYVTGEKEFWSLTFAVNPAVLIPRPETECLVEEALACCGSGAASRIIDIGTGSGAIAVALASELPRAQIAATDLSPAALTVARRNAVRHGLAERIEFLQGDLFAEAEGPFDLICSNPPYITDEDYRLLPAGIREFEPQGALIAGPDGLDVLCRIIREGVRRLSPGGTMLLEIGDGQKESVEALFRDGGFYDNIRFRADYGGIDRVAIARRKEE
ncbi:MAG: peptide chain release factor N(5)-glutamine methyltransferase [Deltaproteobacteria bacterium]|nr:peptide chain release factor N(5)-glutamine methyltransferase [Deltaproteobacteria bacterium]